MKEKIKKRDIVLLVVILLAITVSFISITNREPGKIVEVKKDNQVIQKIDLNKDDEYTFEFNEEINILRIHDGTADVISADCINQVCVNTKPISEVGEVIACLPHGLIFEIQEDES